MKALLNIRLLLLLMPEILVSQASPFRENGKWGIKDGSALLVPAVYDTVFNYDATGKVCLACFTTKKPSANRFIKTLTTTYSCNYLDKKNKRLMIRDENGDTCTVFGMGKKTLGQYNDDSPVFVVLARGRKHAVNKDFRQLTFKGYYDINPSLDTGFYITQYMDDNEVVFTGLIDSHEKEVIPYQYSGIKLNPVDSLIIACSAGVRSNADDDIFDYKGRKIAGYRRHVDMATGSFVIHHIFEPKETFIIYNTDTKEEKTLNASEVHFFEHNEILIRIKSDWYVYDLITNKKKSKQY